MIDYELGGEYTPYPLAHAAQLFDASFHAGKSFVDTGYYKSKYDPTDPNYSQATPIYYDSSFNRIWTKRMLQVGSIVQWEPRNGRDIVSGDTVNEFLDPANKLHFYILDKHMNPAKNGEFLSYQIGVLRTDGVAVAGQLEVIPEVVEAEINGRVAVVNFNITNKSATATDIIRVEAKGGPDTTILNNLFAIDPGKTVAVPVYVSFSKGITGKDLASLTVGLDVSSESNANNKASASISTQTAFANTVTFEDDDGTVFGTQKVVFNTGAEIPANPVRFGYTVTGWNLGDKLYDFNDPVTEDITLVAKWMRNPITFLQIASVDFVAAPALITVPRNSIIQFDYIINSDAIREGILWTVSNSAMAAVIPETGLVMIKSLTGTLLLTAKDSLNGVTNSVMLRIV
jgi:hypothetical protein